MNLLRRITAVLSSALLLQLSLLASGTLCPMHAERATASAATHAGAMSHAHGPVPQRARVVSDPSGVPSNNPAGTCDMTGSSCGMPWSSGGCASMTTCAIGTSAPSAVSLAFAEMATPALLSHSAAELPLGPTYAPELPPPRA